MERVKSYRADEVSRAVEDNGGLLLLHFGSPLASACEMIRRQLETLAPLFDDQLEFGEVEALEDLELTQRYSIEEIPTLVLFRGNTEVERLGEVQTTESLRDFLDAALSFYCEAAPDEDPS